MTSKLTSRFRRRSGLDATNPGAPSAEPAAPPLPETAASEPASADGPKAAEASSSLAKSNPAQPDGDKADAKQDASVTDSPASPAAKHTVPPARLVEVERPKPQPSAPAASWSDRARSYRVPAAAAAALILALGAGYGLGVAAQPEGSGAAKTAQLLESTAGDLRAAHGQIGRLAAELTSIRSAVDAIKGDREKSRGDLIARQAQLSDRVERAGQENATRIGRLAEQLDRIEKAQRDAVRQAAVEKPERVARPEPHEKVAAVPVPPAKPALDPVHTGSIGEAKPDPRKTPLDGYVVRDYDDGFALIETRSGRYIDVAVGYTLPGVGKVEAIERRGRQWVVVTPKGYIAER